MKSKEQQYKDVKNIIKKHGFTKFGEIDSGDLCYKEILDYFSDEMPEGVKEAISLEAQGRFFESDPRCNPFAWLSATLYDIGFTGDD